MFKTNKKRQFAVVLIATSLSACSGFLDETDLSNFTQDNYFTKPEHAETVVNAIYEDLRPSSWALNYGGAPFLMLEFPTGLAGTEVGQNVDNNFLRTLTNNSDNLYGERLWISYYRGIGNANLAIARIPEIAMDGVRKQELIAEARFMRAYYYYQLVRIFGDVPLITTPIDFASRDFFPSRAAVEEVYALIVDDLTQADASSLPYRSASGRATRGAVKSLLASCYLTMAGHPLNKGRAYYELAANKAGEVIRDGQYRLFGEYAELRHPDNKNQGEHIFMTQYEAGLVNNTVQDLFLPNNRNISAYSNESGAIYALDAFIDTYGVGDKRVQDQQYYYHRFTSHADRGVTVELGAHYIYKYFDTDAHLRTATSGMNWPLLRYAEVLLDFAEAQNEVSGPNAEVYAAINAVRARASIALLEGLDQDAFRAAVWTERYHELAFENKTWFDMVRTRKVLDLETGDFNDFVGHTFTYGPTLRARELLFPIPTREIINNKNLVPNPGY